MRRGGAGGRTVRHLPAFTLLSALTLLATLTPAPAGAQIRVAEWEGGGVELAGYVRTLGAVQDLGFDVPAPLERRSAFGGQVARLQWSVRGGDRWLLEVHDRVQLRVTSVGASTRQPAVGFGVSAVPDRSVELETTLSEGPRHRLWHDVDRLALTVYTQAADVTVGRQAITWGLSALFPVADLWSRFSPFELDTEQKPGIDAVRALAYPGEGVELDLVVADRGRLRDLSAGVRATWTLASGDVWAGAGRFWREALLMAGGSLLLEEVKLRAEAVLPWQLERKGEEVETGPAPLRVTAGVEWLTGRWLVAGELHHNGIGATSEAGYVRVLSDRRFARGETYFLGRWYAGALASWQAADHLTLSATALANLEDGSLALTPGLGWDVGPSARLSVGGLLSWGEAPRIAPSPISLRSEFGTYGALGWSQASIYF